MTGCGRLAQWHSSHNVRTFVIPFTDEEICSEGHVTDSHSWSRVGLGARLPYPQAVVSHKPVS